MWCEWFKEQASKHNHKQRLKREREYYKKNKEAKNASSAEYYARHAKIIQTMRWYYYNDNEKYTELKTQYESLPLLMKPSFRKWAEDNFPERWRPRRVKMSILQSRRRKIELDLARIEARRAEWRVENEIL